jgi:glycosyltransferase involved in cell wall biosynthesis
MQIETVTRNRAAKQRGALENCSRMKHQDRFSRTINFLLPDAPRVSPAAQLDLKGHNGLTDQDIVSLSTQDWHDLWTRKQRFMLQFARQGNRVLYVETQFHWVTYFRLFRRHWRRIYLFLLGPRMVVPNLYVYTPPILLPGFQIFPWLAGINNFVLGFFIRFAMNRVGMRRPLLWLYSHFNKSLIKKLGCEKTLYECVDEFSGAKGLVRADVARAQEAETLKAVDLAIVTAPALKTSKERFNRNIFVVPNAANVAHFGRAIHEDLPEPADLIHIARPRLVFVGVIAYWVDLELVRYIVVNRPSWNIVMLGPVATNINIFRGLENVHFLERKPYDVLPDYMAWCDVALNPYKVDSVAENCSPLKLYEYLASGLPIVSTAMPEARRFDGLVAVADSYADFLESIDAILAWGREKRDGHIARAQAEAQRHSWESRFLEVEKIAREALS